MILLVNPFVIFLKKSEKQKKKSKKKLTKYKYGKAISEDGFNYMDDYDTYK